MCPPPFVANEDVITAAFCFNRPPTIAKNASCAWSLTSAAEYAGLRAMAQDAAHFRVSPHPSRYPAARSD